MRVCACSTACRLVLVASQPVAAGCYGPLPGADRNQPGQCTWESQSAFMMCDGPICSGLWHGCVPFEECFRYLNACEHLRETGQALCSSKTFWWPLTCDGVSGEIEMTSYWMQFNAAPHSGTIQCYANERTRYTLTTSSTKTIPIGFNPTPKLPGQNGNNVRG